MNNTHPIAFFDSGVGGISVLKAAIRLLPEENFLFFGDSANAPYGTKSLEEVRRLTVGHVDRLIDSGAKAVVVACNTATSAAISTLREQFSYLPIIGIEPALKPAALFKKHAKILALATPMTIREEKFHELAERFRDEAEIFPLAAPELVSLIEAGEYDSPEMDRYLERLFEPYQGKGIDAIVLGCTHFPFASNAIRRFWNDNVALFDGAEGTAKELARKLTEKNLRNTSGDPGTVKIENSGGLAMVQLSERLLHLPER